MLPFAAAPLEAAEVSYPRPRDEKYSFSEQPLSVSLMDLISKRIRIIGSQQNGPEYLYEALDFVAQGKVKTIVETYPLAEAPKAYDRVAQGKARFRAVLTM